MSSPMKDRVADRFKKHAIAPAAAAEITTLLADPFFAKLEATTDVVAGDALLKAAAAAMLGACDHFSQSAKPSPTLAAAMANLPKIVIA